MKKYKTWEAIKILTEIPALKFRYCYDLSLDEKVEAEIFLDDFGLINFNCASLNPDYEWELVQEPIEFKKAVEAFNKGYTIRCELGADEVTRYNPKSSVDFLMDNTGDSICAKEILEGKWFIDYEISNE
ncbi:MAG: hypothetical protein ABRQ27_12290 [Clostridiaceae bacterium]